MGIRSGQPAPPLLQLARVQLTAGGDLDAKIRAEILPYLPESIRRMVANLPEAVMGGLEEVRIRVSRPLMLVNHAGDQMLRPDGSSTNQTADAYQVTRDDLHKAIQLISQGSLYALEEELKSGYITLPGGHRVGLTGKAVTEKGRIKTLKHISSLNIRLSRAIPGVADKIIGRVLETEGVRVFNTLIVSPPRCGKTTLLRDLIRQLSNGPPLYPGKGFKIGLVDERSEVASCYEGVPQNDVGTRTDVLDGCLKAEGMLLLLRAMSPDIIAADEIGRAEDVSAIEEAVNAGVRVITTVHAADWSELQARPSLKPLWQARVFGRIIFLGRGQGPGTVESILEGDKL